MRLAIVTAVDGIDNLDNLVRAMTSNTVLTRAEIDRRLEAYTTPLAGLEGQQREREALQTVLWLAERARLIAAVPLAARIAR